MTERSPLLAAGDSHSMYRDLHSMWRDRHYVERSPLLVAGDNNSMYRDLHSMYRDLHSVYRDLHSMYRDLHSMYRDIHSMYRDLHSMWRGPRFMFFVGSSHMSLSIYSSTLARIQRRATELIPEQRYLSYEERLKECGLATLETRW